MTSCLLPSLPAWTTACGWVLFEPSLSVIRQTGMDAQQSDFFERELLALLPRLRRYALTLSRSASTAEDLVQATCVRALEYRARFVPGTRLDRWTFSILTSIWHNELRSRRVRQGNGCTEAETVLCIDADEAVEQRVLARQLLDALDRLPFAQKRAVVQVYIKGCSYKEAAEAERVPVGTIMSRLSSARRKLECLLKTF